MAGEQKEDKEQPPPLDDEEEEIDDEESEEEEDEEESQSPPSKVARVSSPTDPSADATTVYAPPQPPVALGLGLGVGGTAPTAEASVTSFTFMQRQELHHHLRVFDYIVRRAPVPLDLVLPIWKSVAASYGPHHYPSFVGLGNLCYDFRNSMEPEPGRCRRTDGKKWRCSRDVIPNEKYCERHMHRGRVRSRKPVEAEASADATATAAADSVSAAAAASLSDTIPIGSSQAVAANNSGSGNADANAAPPSAVACKSRVVVEVEKLPG